MRISTITLLFALSASPMTASIVNVALSSNGGVASATSTNFFGPSNANDGNLSTFFESSGGVDEAWQVTFAQSYYITDATVYNREDCCFGTRLDPFNVYLLDSQNNIVWQSLDNNESTTGPDSLTFSNIDTFGMTFKVQVQSTNSVLDLAEVMVNADTSVMTPEPASCLLAFGGLAAFGLRRRSVRAARASI